MTGVRSVVIADDHPLVRAGLRALLSSLPEFEVLAEAATGEEAVRAAGDHLPDVVVMDLQMPAMDGIEATRRIVSRYPSVGVLVLTMFEDDESVFSAMRAGARGYLLKGAGPDEVTRAIEAVASGQAIFGPAVAARVLRYFSGAPAQPEEVAFPELTPREREILDLVAAGSNNATIARRLSLSAKTVANHVSNILTKLQAADRAEAIIRARRAGLGGD